MKYVSRMNVLVGLLVALVLLTVAIFPGFAQDTGVQTEGDVTIVTGAVQFTPTGDIMVAGIVIAPAGAFNPSGLAEGDLVIITGVLLNETTLQATDFEFFDDETDAEVTPEPTLEVTAEVTAEATLEATAEVTPEAAPVSDCGQPNHPVATRISEAFGVDYNEVMMMHCMGNGFGNIIRAYALAEASEDGSTAQDFIDRHHGGEGWGQIMRDSDVHPSELAPGKVLKNHGNSDDTTTDATTTTTTTSGSGNGNGNGNGGNNGNGNNNGNRGGNSNGNGNGNRGGNGNGGGKPNK